MKSLQRTVLFLIPIFVKQCVAATTTTTTTTITDQPVESSNYNHFATDLFSVIVEGKSLENIVYSPVSIQTCLALTFMGAEGETAEELRKVLRLGDGDRIHVAKSFAKFLSYDPTTNNQTLEVPKLKIVNRLYVNNQLNVSEEFNKIALKYFNTQAEKVNFKDVETVVENINQWVAQKTENKIKDILKPDAVNGDTNALLINAIYFQAKWLNAFSQSSTSTSKFYINRNHSQEVEFMYNEDYYGYAELPDMNATVLEMPYNNSDISMLIILPNDIEGLANLELKLKYMDLNKIVRQISLKKVHVHMPKFRIEFDIDLREPLEKLGLTATFTSSANFESLFTTPEMQSISEVKHKAFLDVNEAGSEAAAATFTTLTTLSGIFDEPIFQADHPFIFAIRNDLAVYFAGHVATI